MATEPDRQTLDVIKEHASAVSMQAQVSNRYWLGLVTVAVISLLQHVKCGQAQLPFGLGTAPADRYYLAAYALLFVLSIAFSAAYVQQVRSQTSALKRIEKLSPGPETGWALPRLLYDNLRLPSFNRVAPLAQTWNDRPWIVRLSGAVYYVVLKTVSVAVYFAVPLWALLHAFYMTRAYPLALPLVLLSVLRIAIDAGLLIAALTLGRAAVADFPYTVTATLKIFKGIPREQRATSVQLPLGIC